MSGKHVPDRVGSETARLLLEQRKPKSTTSATFAPHTPPAQRSLSTFSSPGSILGKEEDAVIIELTSRYLLAGLEGDSGPQCRIFFNPEAHRRVGDYRPWLPTYERKREALESWTQGYELWRNDVKDVNLDLLSDNLERTVREVYNKHLLVDAGAGRLVLVLPSLVPHPVLDTILFTFFERWTYTTITLLPSPAMTVFAGGLRSGLVVDIGWEETVVSAICEFREVSCRRSTRAMKRLTHDFGLLMKERREALPSCKNLRFDLEIIESMLMRAFATITLMGQDSTNPVESKAESRDIEIDWPGDSGSQIVNIDQQELSDILFQTYIGNHEDLYPDEHELPIPQLIFKVLLSLQIDLRGVSMSRIIFTGANTYPPILRHIILKELESIVDERGWTMVNGKRTTNGNSHLNQSLPIRSSLSRSTTSAQKVPDAKHDIPLTIEGDFVEEKLSLQKPKLAPSGSVQPSIREIHSLGPWSGASLLTSLKIRGFVEIDRERFLSHRLSGASRDVDISTTASGTAATASASSSSLAYQQQQQQQQRMASTGVPLASAAGVTTTTTAAIGAASKHTERSSWTLGLWG